MKVTLSEGKMILRFTLNFILHQILMFLLMSVPSVFYLYIFKQNPEEPTYYTLIAVSTLALYFVYCLFYGYYVALPMADIILRIQRLAKGNYEALPKRRFSNPANHLYREVYRNLAALTETLQQEEKRRKEFEKQRQEWAAGVTHDLKTPLSYITGYTDMLLSKQHPWTEEEKEEFLCIMKEKAKYMEELINDLGLAFQMEQSPMALQGMEKIELAEFMRRILAEAASMPKAREDDLEIQVSDSPIYIRETGSFCTGPFPICWSIPLFIIPPVRKSRYSLPRDKWQRFRLRTMAAAWMRRIRSISLTVIIEAPPQTPMWVELDLVWPL